MIDIMSQPNPNLGATRRQRMYSTIFGTDTPAGRRFDIILIWLILASVTAVMLETVAEIRARFGSILIFIEWLFTGIFTLEYILRIWCHPKPKQYAKSFFGIVDLLSVLPTYLGLVLAGSHVLTVVRVFRIVRLFRILKLFRYISEAEVLLTALRNSRAKITVFFTVVAGIVVTMGALMHLVEGEANGFTSIPKSIYWAVTTLTTVGFGDVVPKTVLGQTIATFIMLLGYAILAVPTGIVSVEISQASKQSDARRICSNCGIKDHQSDALFCRKCALSLGEN